jgi:hypothetical protein
MFILKNWAIVKRTAAFGEEAYCLSGDVYGNPNFTEGEFILTSFIRSHRFEADVMVIITRSGSEYWLGRPSVTAAFAKQRLLRYLQQMPALPPFDETGRATEILGFSAEMRMAASTYKRIEFPQHTP